MERTKCITERNFYHHPAPSIVMKVTIDGVFDEARARAAVDLLEGAHPLINCVAEEDGNEVNLVDYDNVHVPVFFCNKNSENSWIDTVRREAIKPMDINSMPLIRFFFFSDRDSFDFVILCHHMLADGMSLKYLIEDFIHVYCAEVRSLRYQRVHALTSEEDLPDGVRLPGDFKDMLASVNNSWKEEKTHFNRKDFESLVRESAMSDGLAYAVRSLAGEDYNRLRKVCHEWDITVNSYLTTAIMYVMSEADTDQKISIATNLREKFSFKVNRCVSVYASCIKPVLQYKSELSFRENAQLVHAAIRKGLVDESQLFGLMQLFLTLDGSIFDALFYARIGKYKGSIIQQVRTALGFAQGETGFDFSNIGKIDMQMEYEKYAVRDIVFCPNLTSVYDYSFGAATLGDNLSLAVCYKENHIPTEKMEEFMDSIIQCIREELWRI